MGTSIRWDFPLPGLPMTCMSLSPHHDMSLTVIYLPLTGLHLLLSTPLSSDDVSRRQATIYRSQNCRSFDVLCGVSTQRILSNCRGWGHRYVVLTVVAKVV
jgi:hypothetical protein